MDNYILGIESSCDETAAAVIKNGRFVLSNVISSQIEPSKRYKKGSIIVGMREGASVISASYVTVPYMLAVVEKNNAVSELSSEDIFISVLSSRAKRVFRYEEDSIKTVIPLPYKKGE